MGAGPAQSAPGKRRGGAARWLPGRERGTFIPANWVLIKSKKFARINCESGAAGGPHKTAQAGKAWAVMRAAMGRQDVLALPGVGPGARR
jgi:hypothetical protein